MSTSHLLTSTMSPILYDLEIRWLFNLLDCPHNLRMRLLGVLLRLDWLSSPSLSRTSVFSQSYLLKIWFKRPVEKMRIFEEFVFTMIWSYNHDNGDPVNQAILQNFPFLPLWGQLPVLANVVMYGVFYFVVHFSL